MPATEILVRLLKIVESSLVSKRKQSSAKSSRITFFQFGIKICKKHTLSGLLKNSIMYDVQGLLETYQCNMRHIASK